MSFLQWLGNCSKNFHWSVCSSPSTMLCAVTTSLCLQTPRLRPERGAGRVCMNWSVPWESLPPGHCEELRQYTPRSPQCLTQGLAYRKHSINAYSHCRMKANLRREKSRDFNNGKKNDLLNKRNLNYAHKLKQNKIALNGSPVHPGCMQENQYEWVYLAHHTQYSLIVSISYHWTIAQIKDNSTITIMAQLP